jgi:hypothetical protein
MRALFMLEVSLAYKMTGAVSQWFPLHIQASLHIGLLCLVDLLEFISTAAREESRNEDRIYDQRYRNADRKYDDRYVFVFVFHTGNALGIYGSARNKR